jgi:hypothetical protein
MSFWSHLPIRDWFNEGWTLNGGVFNLWEAWNNDDDNKYASCPPNKGRGACTFPVDITSVPDGAAIVSVTIYLRCSRDGTPGRSVTVNVSCTDDPSRFTSRTIFPTATPTTIEVGTYRFDPLGFLWDRNRLNKLICQVFSYSGVAGAIRCHKFYCVLNYRVRPTVKVNAPTGTVNTPSPVASWTYAQVDGDPQVSAQYKIFTATQQSAQSFNPDVTVPVYNGVVTGATVSLTLPTSLVSDNYYIYVRATASSGAKSVWTGRSFTVLATTPGVPGGTVGGPGTGGGGFISVIGDGVTSNAFLTLRDGSNILGVNAADFSTVTDYIGYVGTNCTLSRDTSTEFTAGGGSLKMVCTTGPTNMSALGAYIEVATSAPITVRAQFQAAATGKTCNVSILFYDATYTLITGTITGTGTSVVGSWTEVSATGTTPATAVYAQVKLEVVGPATSSVHNVDGVGLMYGSNAVWSDGGHTSRNLLSNIASNADTPPSAQAEPWSANAAATYTRTSNATTGADGGNAFRLTYVGLSPTVSYVAAGTTYSDTSNATGYTLNKPAGVADGDLLVAFVSSIEDAVITVPSGWDLVNSASLNNGVDDVALWILTRDGLAADPATWVGNLSIGSTRRRATVFAYRGAAPSAMNFNIEGTTTSTSGNPVVTTSTINNTRAGSWRISAFAFRDDVTGGTAVANTQAPVVIPSISFVSAASSWSNSSSNAAYTVNKPVGVISGDLMIASVCAAGIVTVTAPSGWTVVRTTTRSVGNGDDHSGSVTFSVLKRTAGGSEPTSWAGTFGSNSGIKITNCVAYRNVADASLQFIAENGATGTTSSTVTTATVSNTNSNAWRISMLGVVTDNGANTSGGGTERSDASTGVSGIYDTSVHVYDSGGTISTGNQSSTTSINSFSSGGFFGSAGAPKTSASWIGLIKPLAAAPTPPANETERLDTVTGGSDPCLTTAVYDTNGVAALGSQSVTGVFTPGSGTVIDASASWIGIIEPAVPTIAGEAGMTLAAPVDLSLINPRVYALADNKVTFQTSVTGSTAGTPYLTLYFYVGNELIGTRIAQGTSFTSAVWQKSLMTVDLPPGTTRVSAKLHVSDRVISDLVYFDRVAISLGDSPVYRPGTGRTAHAVWCAPLIEYADDDGTGYGSWADVPGSDRALLSFDQLTGIATFTDQSIIPLNSRKYRARTLSYGLMGDQFMSPYGPESEEINISAAEWWLKDTVFPENSMMLKVKAAPLAVSLTNTTSVFQPLGADLPNVLTEGYKGDVIELTLMLTRTEYGQLKDLLSSGRTLFLQSNMDNAWWVRSVGDLDGATQLTSKRFTDPLRFVKVQFVQVAAQE